MFLLIGIESRKTAKSQSKQTCVKTKKVKRIAESGFDPPTSGLWAQHASTAPLCFPLYTLTTAIFNSVYNYYNTTFYMVSKRENYKEGLIGQLRYKHTDSSYLIGRLISSSE